MSCIITHSNQERTCKNEVIQMCKIYEAVKFRMEKLFPSNELIECLTNFCISEYKNIKREKKIGRNLPLSFLNVGNFGEEMSLYMFPKSFGGASKGGIAYDNIEYNDSNVTLAREIKFVCREGTKQCKDCKLKSPRYQNVCIKCKKNNFKLFNDSRAGIDSSAHHKYKNIIKEYIIFVLDTDLYGNVVYLKCFKFNSNNNYFDSYIENQFNNSKSNCCNFLPFSYDWYLSGPIKLFDFRIKLGITPIIDKKYYNLNNDMNEKVPISIFRKSEIKKFDLNPSYTFVDYENTSHIGLRHKNLNKKRGVVKR